MAKGVPPVVGRYVGVFKDAGALVVVGMGDGGEAIGAFEDGFTDEGESVGGVNGAPVGDLVVPWKVGIGDGGEKKGEPVGVREVVGSGEGGETIGAFVVGLEVVGATVVGLDVVGIVVGIREGDAVGTGEGYADGRRLDGTDVGVNVGDAEVRMLTPATNPVEITLPSD